MRLLLCSFLVPLVCASDAPPLSKGLLAEDSDLLRTPQNTAPRAKPKAQANGVLQNEITDLPQSHNKWTTDDYSDFASEPVRNGGANHHLKPVTYNPIPKKYEIPSPEPDTDDSTNGRGSSPSRSGGRPQQAQYYVAQVAPQPRQGYFYQHYPYYNLPIQYRMRPRYLYTYPPQYQNVQYTYYHPLPYTDPYSIYRNDPRFNPHATAGCGGSSGCGGGCGGGGSSCGGGCGGGAGGSSDGCGDDSEDEEEASFENDGEGRSGDAHINKKDPLDDIDLEDLEKLEKASSSERTKARRSRKQHRS